MIFSVSSVWVWRKESWQSCRLEARAAVALRPRGRVLRPFKSSRRRGQVCLWRVLSMDVKRSGRSWNREIIRGLGPGGQFHKSLIGALLAALMTMVWAGAARAEPLQEALRGRIERVYGADLPAVLALFYAQRDYRPAWPSAEQALALVTLVETLPSHGLDTADFPLAALRQAAGETNEEPGRLAERDVLFSATLARLVRQLSSGKVDPRALYPEWNFAPPPGAPDAAATLENLLREPDLEVAVARLAPQTPEYQGLRSALARYRQLQEAGGWARLAEGPVLKPGMRDPRVPALRNRLAAEGEAGKSAGNGAVFDEALAGAVARFQARHGLEPDGVVGERTLAELNVPVAARIDQIRVNRERLRWVARDRVGDHLLVDIAGYTARLYLNGQLAWDSKVVVGRPYRKTPAFRADMEYLVLNPRWVVPPTILREDVLPKLAGDPGYLAAHDMHVMGGAGRAHGAEAIRAGAPYQIVQAPGPKNPLGQIKFMLPNPHSIYLHDTPSRNLFKRTERAESSGCVRLEKPLDLAVLLLDDAGHWNRQALQAELATGRTRTVYVKYRVPVLVLYFTAEADGAGAVAFRPDLYQRDPQVLSALDVELQ